MMSPGRPEPLAVSLRSTLSTTGQRRKAAFGDSGSDSDVRPGPLRTGNYVRQRVRTCASPAARVTRVITSLSYHSPRPLPHKPHQPRWYRYGSLSDKLGSSSKCLDSRTHFVEAQVRLQRNDAYDAYNTFPLHQRTQPKEDVFAEGVQRTQ